METFKKVKIGGTIFAVGESAEFVNVGMGGMAGVVTAITIVGGLLYIYAVGNKGVKVRLENGDIAEGESPVPIETSRRR